MVDNTTQHTINAFLSRDKLNVGIRVAISRKRKAEKFSFMAKPMRDDLQTVFAAEANIPESILRAGGHPGRTKRATAFPRAHSHVCVCALNATTAIQRIQRIHCDLYWAWGDHSWSGSIHPTETDADADADKMQDAEVDTDKQPHNALYLVLIPASQGASCKLILSKYLKLNKSTNMNQPRSPNLCLVLF